MAYSIDEQFDFDQLFINPIDDIYSTNLESNYANKTIADKKYVQSVLDKLDASELRKNKIQYDSQAHSHTKYCNCMYNKPHDNNSINLKLIDMQNTINELRQKNESLMIYVFILFIFVFIQYSSLSSMRSLYISPMSPSAPPLQPS